MCFRRYFAPGALLLFSLSAAAGCAGRRSVSLEDELSEVRFERDRALAALRESLSREQGIASSLRAALEEKEAVVSESVQKETAVRYLAEQARRLSAERAELERGLNEARESERKVRDNHARLMDVATSSTEELADLRHRAQGASTERDKLASENQTLQKHLEASVRELDDLKSELTRTRAVVRSLQEQSPSRGAGGGSEGVLRARIAELEHALQAAQAAGEAGGDGGGRPAAQGALASSPRGVGNDEEAVWRALLGLLQARGEALLRREFRGDALEWAALAAAAASFVAALWLWWVLRSRKKLRRQLVQLRASVRHPPEPQPSAEGGEGGPVPAARQPHSGEEAPVRQAQRRPVHPPPRDERDFSAIISAPRGKKGAEAADAARAPGAASEGRRVIGSPLLDGRESRKGTAGARPPQRERPAPPAAPSPEANEPESEDEMAHTQIISPLSVERGPASHKGSGRPAKGQEDREEGGDKELLDELKAVINKKFDELMK